MITTLVLSTLMSFSLAAPHGAVLYGGVGILGPAYNAPILPVETLRLDQPKGGLSYTATNTKTLTGEVKQQTAVGKDSLGGHTIRHSAQASNVDPHSGQTDIKHDDHEFHINPYSGEAAVHTNTAEASLNPSIGQAAFTQKTHQAKIAPGHASVADVQDTAAVSPVSSAASKDVNAARTDVLLDGVAKNAHTSHKSYVNVPGVAGESEAYEANRRSFDGHGHGNLHYDTQSAKQAYDALGHASASETGYKLDQAYDARLNLGASNELEYSRHAAHDPYGNYGAVTQTREASQGGQLVPAQPAIVVQEVKEPVVYKHPVVVKTPVSYTQEAVLKSPVAYEQPSVVQAPIVYNDHAVVYGKQVPVVYNEPAAVYDKQGGVFYGEHAPVSYNEQTSIVYKEPSYKEPVVYTNQAYAPSYPQDGYYYKGY